MTDPVTSPVRTSDAAALARLHPSVLPELLPLAARRAVSARVLPRLHGRPHGRQRRARDSGGNPVGAVVGTVEPQGFYKRLLRRRLLGLSLASARAAIRRPRNIGRLVRGAAYRGEASTGATPTGALLSSICTEPHLQGTGIGRRLVAEREIAAAAKGATSAYLTTDAVANQKANAFYDRCGWHLDAEYVTREGRRMNLYTKELRP